MRACIAAWKRNDHKGYYSLVRLCGNSVPPSDLVKAQSNAVWVSLLRQRTNPSIAVSAGIVVSTRRSPSSRRATPP